MIEVRGGAAGVAWPDRIFNRYMGVDYSGALTKNATKRGP
jgi:hypothetical protein